MAAKRKPLPIGCNGSIDCEVLGHLEVARTGFRFRFSHIKLTDGQRKTLRERRAAAEVTE